MMRKLAWISFALLTAATLSACGSRQPQSQTEEQRVQDVVSSAPDMATKPVEFRKCFTAGTVPDQATFRKIALATLIPERPRIQGEQATVTVSVQMQGQPEPSKVDWILVKEEDQWKIQSAPMP